MLHAKGRGKIQLHACSNDFTGEGFIVIQLQKKKSYNKKGD